MSVEAPQVFECHGSRLLGMLHPGAAGAATGVVIIVGGPQYRVGSHRQFVLMARRLAENGVPVLRFDYRGMGDGEGATRSFAAVDDDVRAAVDCLCGRVPSVRNVVLLGLCDAASAALIYAPSDERVAGLILLNPWVRTESGEARTYLRHYYLKRLFQASFWQKVLSGNWKMKSSLSELKDSVKSAAPADPSPADDEAYLEPMLRGLREFGGEILLLISGRDLTAQEFTDLCAGNRHWKKAVRRPRVSVEHFPDADHTMSGRQDLDAASDVCSAWVRRLD